MAEADSAVSFDIDARMAQVVGKPPRVAPVGVEDLTEDQMAMIKHLRGSINVRSTGEKTDFFRIVAKHPELFRCQMEMGTMLFTGTIPPRERELAVLRIAWLCRAPYEWGEHVDIARRYGISAEEIERATLGSAAPGWSEHESAILRGVEELLDDKMVSDETWEMLARRWTEQQLLEFPTLVGAYVSTAMQQNTLRVRLEAENPGLRHR